MSSEAKLALAEVYAGQGKLNDGVQLIQSVIDHPTVMVSKDAAILALADLIKTQRSEARQGSWWIHCAPALAAP